MSIDHTITLSEAHHLARRAVAERGATYVYHHEFGNNCAYFTGQHKPGCMVGLMLSYVGLEAKDVLARFANNSGVNSLAHFGLFSAPEEVVSFLTILQGMQDTGSTWEQAYSHASMKYPDPGGYEVVPTVAITKDGEKPVSVFNPMTNSFEEELTVPTDWVNDTAEAKAKDIEKELIDA